MGFKQLDFTEGGIEGLRVGGWLIVYNLNP